MKRHLTQDPDDNLIYLTVEKQAGGASRKKKKRVTWKELGAKEFTGERSAAISKDLFSEAAETKPET